MGGSRLAAGFASAARSAKHQRSVALRGGSSSTLESLRRELRARSLDGLVIPSDDPHLSEYVAPCFERRAFATGFTGSAGTALVTLGGAYCWTDGRYWLQASKELEEGWELMKAGEPGVAGVAEWLGSDAGAAELGAGAVLGISAPWRRGVRRVAAGGGGGRRRRRRRGVEPVDAVWGAARPPAPRGPCGSTRALARTRRQARPRPRALQALDASALAVTALDEVAWLLNVRGGDVECNPVALSFAVVTEDGCAVKNDVELACMRDCHVRDGAYACEAFCELEDRVRAGDRVDEVDVDAALLKYRSRDPGFLEPSFPTIAGSGPNGAVIHYRAERPNCRDVTKDAMLLVDSGAQYVDGTTDATRTWHFGTPTAAEKRAYTAVLKGNIGLDVAVFPDETVGFVLDAFARKPLWALGLDYGHGTGHGVGAALNVHEGPVSISPRFGNTEPLKAGMVLSNEPGQYVAGEFGVRIENLLEVGPLGDLGGGKDFLKFEKLTMIPIDLNCVDAAMLDAPEVAWIDARHADVPRLARASRPRARLASSGRALQV
ncbi:peptidase [Aureococcus anophagefferens]|nr:peptidase [Aureococcus anophagefferens]